MERKRKIRYGWTAALIASLFLVVGCGSISGTVSSGGEPLAGVTVELEGPACATAKTTTDDCGNYRFPWVAKGNYTVTPSLTGYSFTPENQSVKMNKERHVTDVNFEGVPGIALYSISGTITAGVGTLSGLTVSIAGVTSASTTTDAGGNYRFSDLPGGGYTVTPSPIPGYGFTPADVTLNADMTVNFDATPNTVRAWGLGESGQLGNNQTADSPVPVPVVNLSRVVAVAGGVYHSLALLDDGAVRAWGQGTSGQLGYGSFADSLLPVPVDTTRWAAGRRVTAIAAGGFHSLALLDDGTVWAWGLGVYGQLGNGANDDYPFPTAVDTTWGAGKKVVAVAGGVYHSLALLDDGTVWAWGVGTSGQLGNGQFDNSSVPVQVQGLTGITAIACGGYHSMAVGSGGTVWTWGDNIDGRLGWDTAGWPSSIPDQVTGLSGVISVAGGDYHSMAVTSTGTVWAWGLNSEGRLGVDPSSTPGGFSITPVAVTGLTGVVNVAAGGSHSVAATSDGSVWTWGLNDHGQLGNGSSGMGSYEFNPAAVSGLSNIIKVAAGSSHTLAVKSP